MPELSLKQIIDKLNTEFDGTSRRIVFWYDDSGDFAEDIDYVILEHAKVWKLDGHNQFETKMLLEREDKESSYLVYAPYSEPSIAGNHLADISLYAKRFYADRASLILVDLGLKKDLLPLIQKHIKFFSSKDRLRRFYALEVDSHTEESLLTAMMCVLCRVKVVSFDEVVRVVLTADSLQENSYLLEFAKYDLLEVFWDFCQQEYGYADEQPNLTKLTATLMLTYASRKIDADLPEQWKHFASEKAGSIMAFLDGMMNHLLYQDGYDKLVDVVEQGLHVSDVLAAYEPAALVDCDTFRCIDDILLHWITERLLAEDLSIKIGNYSILDLCEMRPKMHFWAHVAKAYQMLMEAYHMIAHTKYTEPVDFENAFQQYIDTDYKLDTCYRHFYQAYDGLDTREPYEELRELVENIYTNEYLGHQLPAWNQALVERGGIHELPLQTHFYRDYLRFKKEKTVVIISDAFRYEAAYELFERLSDGEKYRTSIKAMMSVLPSYTRLGMLALLPHQTLELSNDGDELIDGQRANDLKSRQTILQSVEPNSSCISFDELKKLKKEDRRKVFTGKQVVYVYHDQVDNAGENAPDTVFEACETAITEIADMIQLLSTTANTQHFIVTADHGFIYKRDAVTESGKISGVGDKHSIVKRRYIVADYAVEDAGICHLPLGKLLENNDKKIVSFPLSHNVFKAPGGGLNYVHGGSSPQELIVPIVEVYAEKGRIETQLAEIKMVTMLHKITNLITTMEFVQSDAVSDMVKAANYSLYFVDDKDMKVTSVENYVADSREKNTAKRIFKVRFSFKNQSYDSSRKYYLVIMNQDTGIELSRHEVVIDVAFAGDFGF